MSKTPKIDNLSDFSELLNRTATFKEAPFSSDLNDVRARRKPSPSMIHPEVLAREVRKSLREVPAIPKDGFSNEAIEMRLGIRSSEASNSEVTQTYAEYLEEYKRKNAPYRSVYTNDEQDTEKNEFRLNSEEFPPL